MKKLLVLLTFVFCSSCQTTIKSPVTQIEYTGAIDYRGISITAKPPFWDYACDLWDWMVN